MHINSPVTHDTPDMPRYTDGASGGPNEDRNKQTMGWQHSDRVLVEDGVVFNVRYIGCLEIKASMKLLDFTTRSQVAK